MDLGEWNTFYSLTDVLYSKENCGESFRFSSKESTVSMVMVMCILSESY